MPDSIDIYYKYWSKVYNFFLNNIDICHKYYKVYNKTFQQTINKKISDRALEYPFIFSMFPSMFSPNSVQRLYYDWIKNFDPEIEKMLKTEDFLKLISNHFTLISDIKSNLDNIFPFANHFHKIFDEIQRNTLAFFSIRKDSELSPFDIEYTNGNTRLLHFRNKNAQNSGNHPLLIIYATINRFHIMDIEPDKSVIRSLLKRGLDVYVLDWGYPTTFGDTSLEDYLRYVKEAVHHIQFKSRLQTNSNKRFLNFAQSLANHDDIYNRNDGINSNSKISIIGYCWGGLIALIYASYTTKM